MRIMLRHMLPNTFAPLIIVAPSVVGGAIIIEASLSFLGVGLPNDIISWGGMLGRWYWDFDGVPWFFIFPGFALSFVVFGINVFRDALRDVLDPKPRGR